MRRTPGVALALTLALGAAACSSGSQASGGSVRPAATASAPSTAPSTEVSPMPTSPSSTGPSAVTVSFTLTSSAFADGGAIPSEFTCDGANVSPPLAFVGAPAGAAALVLLVDDPDAHDFVHWIVLDLPGGDGRLGKGIAPSTATLQQGTNGFGKEGWGGPCPPSGMHHYRFTLTALAAPLGLAGHPDGDTVRAALAGAQVLGTANLSATYTRK